MIRWAPGCVHFVAIMCFGLSFASLSAPGQAQDAAETAIILGGTSAGQSKAQGRLGSAISTATGRAASEIDAQRRIRQHPLSAGPRRSRRTGHGKFAISLPSDVDPLENANVQSHALPNGTTIKVSGGLRRPAGVQPEQRLRGEQ